MANEPLSLLKALCLATDTVPVQDYWCKGDIPCRNVIMFLNHMFTEHKGVLHTLFSAPCFDMGPVFVTTEYAKYVIVGARTFTRAFECSDEMTLSHWYPSVICDKDSEIVIDLFAEKTPATLNTVADIMVAYKCCNLYAGKDTDYVKKNRHRLVPTQYSIKDDTLIIRAFQEV